MIRFSWPCIVIYLKFSPPSGSMDKNIKIGMGHIFAKKRIERLESLPDWHYDSGSLKVMATDYFRQLFYDANSQRSVSIPT
ncbi:hypothetical protein Nepgr_012029 [Nepenthes gracilis]|uniref:Uncharacterized protein n=1 Tax=Nepenthes gracilis TaxID=150966 RepID=A0AAD3SF94_NEPGR|nr:hypothetical protein Nepgr_012029 [Nepenthes gracilis]